MRMTPVVVAIIVFLPGLAHAASEQLTVPLNRAALVTTGDAMTEVVVANPEIAKVYAHNTTTLSVTGNRIGSTNVRAFNRDGAVIRDFDVDVSYDLPAVRRAIKAELPNEAIGVEMAGMSVALTGRASNAAVSARAMEVASKVLNAEGAATPPMILNQIQVAKKTLFGLTVPGAVKDTVNNGIPEDTARQQTGIERFFFRRLAEDNSKTFPGVEGPIGFMID